VTWSSFPATRRPLGALTAAALVLGGLALAPVRPAAATAPGLRAGVASVDMTWHVGASAGQYADTNGSSPGQDGLQSEWDPNLQHVTKTASYGVASRLSTRALVIEGADGTRVAMVKVDNYLAQDYLTRRVAQLLAGGTSGITYDHILVSASHDHSSPYYSTPSAGVWVFQDVFDLRAFEYQARAIASAVTQAAAALRPVRMGATTVTHNALLENIVGPTVGDDGSPAGYPRRFNDDGLVVMRFDDVSDPSHPTPYATWMNFGEHPESLDGYQLISEDYLAPLQRFVDRDTGSTLVFTQGAVGSQEGPYESHFGAGQIPVLSDGTLQAFAHAGYAQAERGARLMADDVIRAWRTIGSGGGQVPFSRSVPVKMMTTWVPGPVSHPYPSTGNCRTQTTTDGDPGGPGLPDCERTGTGVQSPLYENLRKAGLPLPDSYALSSFSAVEENVRLKLQVVRLGEVLLASCSCEPQVDLILNLESRTDKQQGDIWDGYDYGPTCRRAGVDWSCTDPRDPAKRIAVTAAAYSRMKAEVHNDAKGWDDPAYAPEAGSEPVDSTKVKGNFTKTELPASLGYTLPVGLGHTGDYSGYTVSYREYQNRESYRKALTAYGPHTADYMVTRLVKIAGFLKGGPALPPEPNDAQGQADEIRQASQARALGQLSSFYYDGWAAQLPDDVGPAASLVQPKDVRRFDGVSFTWRGGGNYVDNPTVTVERQVDGRWRRFATQSGEVITELVLPPGGLDLLTTRTGTQEWTWRAHAEAFDAFPRHDVPGGQVPNGTYRFAVAGTIHTAGKVVPYRLSSKPFTVSPWEGIVAGDPRLEAGGAVSFPIAPIRYPRTYASLLMLIKDDQGKRICRTCTFRPWATSGQVETASVTVVRGGQVLRRIPAALRGGRWHAATRLAVGERAYVARAGVRDAFGELNGRPTLAVGPDGSLSGVSPAADRSTLESRGASSGALPTTGGTGPAALGGFALSLALLLLRRRRTRHA
jgi:hypothetical protein